MAELMRAGRVAMRKSGALIEDEALALPQALLRGHGFQIFQDAALQVINLVEALLLQIGRRLLAANAAGAEHREFALAVRVRFAR